MHKGGLFNYADRWWMRGFLALFFLVLYAPVITLVAYSFNDSRRNIVWRGFTGKYYAKAWNNDSLIDAFFNSLTIAFANMFFATLLGLAAAILLWRFRFPFRTAYEGALMLPVVIPEICMGVAMLVFFNKWWPGQMPWPLNLGNIIIAHITFTFPFVAIIIRARLASLNRELEQAAMDLGAGEWRAFYDILLPQLKPALIAGALIAFTLSPDDFVITYFTASPDSVTLPVKINSMVRFSVTPEINAASTVLIIITVASVWLATRFLRAEQRGRRRSKAMRLAIRWARRALRWAMRRGRVAGHLAVQLAGAAAQVAAQVAVLLAERAAAGYQTAKQKADEMLEQKGWKK